MKKEEMNYEKWLEQLKKTPPVLENPDALTEDIMRTVKAAPFRNRVRPQIELCCLVFCYCCNPASRFMGGRGSCCRSDSILRGDSYTETLSRANTHR